jgi:hypothetical protein
LPNLTSLFGPHLSPKAQIILPTEDNFAAELTPRWTDYNRPTYVGAIKPATEGDIQKTVSLTPRTLSHLTGSWLPTMWVQG